MENLTPTEQQAHAQAEQFARRLNEQQNQHVRDWQPRVKLESVGVTTIPNYAFNSLTQDPHIWPDQPHFVDPKDLHS